MSPHLWSWMAIFIQFGFAIVFALLSRARVAHPIRRITFILAVLLFVHTLYRFVAAWYTSPWHLPAIKLTKPEEVFWYGALQGIIWFVYYCAFLICSLAMTWGSIVLTACRTSEEGIFVNPKSFVAWVFNKLDINLQESVCRISWGTAGLIVWFFVKLVMVSIFGVLIGGLFIFFWSGKQPFRAFQQAFLDVYEHEAWHTVKIGKVPIVPCLPTLAALVVWLVSDWMTWRLFGWLVLIVAVGLIVNYLIGRIMIAQTAIKEGKAAPKQRAMIVAPSRALNYSWEHAMEPLGSRIAQFWAKHIKPLSLLIKTVKGILCPIVKWDPERRPYSW